MNVVEQKLLSHGANLNAATSFRLTAQHTTRVEFARSSDDVEKEQHLLLEDEQPWLPERHDLGGGGRDGEADATRPLQLGAAHHLGADLVPGHIELEQTVLGKNTFLKFYEKDKETKCASKIWDTNV